jgi:hypothetical protein
MLIEDIFTVLICIQFLVMAVHDLVHIPGLTHGRQVMAAVGPVKVFIGTAVNSILAGIPAVFAIVYWHKPKPDYLLNGWLIYCAFVCIGMIQAWWLPYFRGTDDKTKNLYAKMYAGTWQILPPHGDNPRPNVLHLVFHTLFLITFVFALLLRLRIA